MTTASLTAAPLPRWREGAWAGIPANRVIHGFAGAMHAAFIFFA